MKAKKQTEAKYAWTNSPSHSGHWCLVTSYYIDCYAVAKHLQQVCDIVTRALTHETTALWSALSLLQRTDVKNVLSVALKTFHMSVSSRISPRSHWLITASHRHRTDESPTSHWPSHWYVHDILTKVAILRHRKTSVTTVRGP